MGNFILQHGGVYAIWSTITDSPTWIGMTQQNVRDYTSFKQGQDGLDDLPERLARADAKGTSARRDKNLEDTVSCNRAGWQGRNLPYEKIIQIFFVEQRLPVEEDGGRWVDEATDEYQDYVWYEVTLRDPETLALTRRRYMEEDGNDAQLRAEHEHPDLDVLGVKRCDT